MIYIAKFAVLVSGGAPMYGTGGWTSFGRVLSVLQSEIIKTDGGKNRLDRCSPEYANILRGMLIRGACTAHQCARARVVTILRPCVTCVQCTRFGTTYR